MKVIFRDVTQAYLLSIKGYSKPAVILARGVCEELQRNYLASKNISLQKYTFGSYIKVCGDKRLLLQTQLFINSWIQSDIFGISFISRKRNLRNTLFQKPLRLVLLYLSFRWRMISKIIRETANFPTYRWDRIHPQYYSTQF